LKGTTTLDREWVVSLNVLYGRLYILRRFILFYTLATNSCRLFFQYTQRHVVVTHIESKRLHRIES